jgi:hypothetical protein
MAEFRKERVTQSFLFLSCHAGCGQKRVARIPQARAPRLVDNDAEQKTADHKGGGPRYQAITLLRDPLTRPATRSTLSPKGARESFHRAWLRPRHCGVALRYTSGKKGLRNPEAHIAR